MRRTFDDLIAEAEAAPVDGWDFSWLDGRATENARRGATSACCGNGWRGCRPRWTFTPEAARCWPARPPFPPTMAVIETWPPNAVLATQRLHPLGAVVVATRDEPPLPFADDAFDLVTTRHPISVWWTEIFRVLRPGGTYFAQHIGPATMAELVEYFIGPQPEKGTEFHPDAVRAQAEAAGLQIVDLRMERMRAEFFDVGAIVYFLRKVIWSVPDFTVQRYRDRLAELHERIESEGPFVTDSVRLLVEARKPA